ncbi:unnamed protein product [Rhizopus microsporus]
MVKFESKPYGQTSAFDALATQAKKRPFLYFGLPFLTIMHRKVEKEEALGMDKNRRTLSLQEEYFRLQSKTDDEWEQVRITRPSEYKK